MPHEQTRRDKEVSAALSFAISHDQGQGVKSLQKTGHTEYHATLFDGASFTADSVSYNEQHGEIAFVLKKRIKVKLAKEQSVPVLPKENFFRLGNPLNIVPEIIGGALELIQTCGQKGIEASIEAAAGIFDISSGIVSTLEDHLDSAFDSLFSGDDSLEILLICCDLWDSVERCCQIPWTEE